MSNLVTQLEDSIKALINRMFPLLVAEELKKLAKETNHSIGGMKRDEILRLKKEGIHNAEIARRVGCQPSYVYTVLKSEKVNGAAAPAPTAPTTMKAALELHGSKTAAAKALGMAESTFRGRLAKELAA
jgi:hypothetical protein